MYSAGEYKNLPRTKMTEICGGIVVEVLLLYLKWTRVYTRSGACDPPLYAAVRSPRVTSSLDVFKIVGPRRTLMRLAWARWRRHCLVKD